MPGTIHSRKLSGNFFGNVLSGPTPALARLLADPRIRMAPDPGALPRSWCLQMLAGRLVELSTSGASAALAAAIRIVHEGQLRCEPAAWIATWGATFYPPDVAESGVDVNSLPLVWVSHALDGAKAAEELLRSGAFGIVVLDLGAQSSQLHMPLPIQTRLAALAKKHETAVLCLTRKTKDAPSLGSLVSLRVQGSTRRVEFARFVWELHVLKDKQRGTGWRHEEVCRGPHGLY